MAMRDWIEELGSWFELCGEAVLGVQRGKIVFENSAAVELLGEWRGKELSAVLPQCPQEGGEGSFTLFTPWEKGMLRLSGLHRGEMLVLRAEREEAVGPRVDAGLLNAMRSALYQIQLPAERLLRLLPEKEEDLYGSSMRHACYLMRRMVENLGDLNEMATGSLQIAQETVDLSGVSGELLNTVRCLLDKNHPTLEEEYGERCFVVGERRRLEQILACLLSNALIRTPPEGHIRVHVYRSGEWVHLTVADSGRCLPAHLSGGVYTFESMEGMDMEGLGLDFSLVWGLIKLQQGLAMIESREGQGVTAHLRFPAVDSLSIRDKSGEGANIGDVLRDMSVALSHRAYRNRYTD